MTPAQVAALLRAQVNASIASANNNIVLKDSQTLALLNRAVVPLAVTGTANIDAALNRVEAEIWNFIEAEYLEKELITESILESLEQLASLKGASPSASSGGIVNASAVIQTASTFTTAIDLSRLMTIYSSNVTAQLTFSLASGSINGGSAVYDLVANGNPAHVPIFPSNVCTLLAGSGPWVNSSGTRNLITFTHINGSTYYSINQSTAPIQGATIDPLVETFLNIVRRTSDITLSGTTYTGTSASSIWTSHGQSDQRLTGVGYVRVSPGAANTGRPMWGLSSNNVANQYTNWKYAVARNDARTYVDYYLNGTLVNSAFLPVDADIRLIRDSGGVVKAQHKTDAATSWTDIYTFTEAFSGNLWFNFSLNAPHTSGAVATLINPRMLGAS
jgi:hypothetical protein